MATAVPHVRLRGATHRRKMTSNLSSGATVPLLGDNTYDTHNVLLTQCLISCVPNVLCRCS